MTIHLAGNLYTPSAVRFIRIIPKPIGLALRPVPGLPRLARRFQCWRTGLRSFVLRTCAATAAQPLPTFTPK